MAEAEAEAAAVGGGGGGGRGGGDGDGHWRIQETFRAATKYQIWPGPPKKEGRSL